MHVFVLDLHLLVVICAVLRAKSQPFHHQEMYSGHVTGLSTPGEKKVTAKHSSQKLPSANLYTTHVPADNIFRGTNPTDFIL